MTKAKSLDSGILTDAEIVGIASTEDHAKSMLAFAREIEKRTALKIAEGFERDGIDWVGRAIRGRL